MLRTPLGATSTRNTRISSRLISAALLMPVPEVAAIGLRTSGPGVPGVCATTADPIHTIATTTDDASVALSMTPPLFTFHFPLFTFYFLLFPLPRQGLAQSDSSDEWHRGGTRDARCCRRRHSARPD